MQSLNYLLNVIYTNKKNYLIRNTRAFFHWTPLWFLWLTIKLYIQNSTSSSSFYQNKKIIFFEISFCSDKPTSWTLVKGPNTPEAKQQRRVQGATATRVQYAYVCKIMPLVQDSRSIQLISNFVLHSVTLDKGVTIYNIVHYRPCRVQQNI